MKNIDELFLNKETSTDASEQFQRAVDMGVRFKTENKFKEKKIDNDNLPDFIKLGEDGTDISKILDGFEKDVIPYCSNFGNTAFMGFPDAGNSVSAICGALVSDFMQQNLINQSYCAPIATHMEIEVIQAMRKAIGFETKDVKNILDVGGIVTYGGTGSNASAMLLARENFKKKTGNDDTRDFKVIIPKNIGHYSIRSSMAWLGCNKDVIEVETINYKYNLEKLQEALDENKGHIMAVVCYAGDSRAMMIDNLEKVYNLVKASDPNIWCHVDACHGFSVAFCEKYRYRVKGINLFDSLSSDPHKVFALPYCCSVMLVKDPKSFELIASKSDLIMNEDFALGQITPFIGSKSWVSLKLWFFMKNLGAKGISDLIEKRIDTANLFRQKLINSDDFVVLNETDINSVIFMYCGKYKNSIRENTELVNDMNLRLYQKVKADGIYYVHQFSFHDDTGLLDSNTQINPLRYMSGNNNLSENDLDTFLNYLRNTAERMC